MSTIWKNICFFPRRKTDAIEDVLLRVPIFQGMNHLALRKIKGILYQREYGEGEAIFHQGDIGLGMYIILKGAVEIVSEPGGELLAELSDGEFFGELALLDESPRSATARAKRPCTMVCFFKPELLDLIDRDPKLGSRILFKLAWTIGERLKATNEVVRELSRLGQQNGLHVL